MHRDIKSDNLLVSARWVGRGLEGEGVASLFKEERPSLLLRLRCVSTDLTGASKRYTVKVADFGTTRMLRDLRAEDEVESEQALPEVRIVALCAVICTLSPAPILGPVWSVKRHGVATLTFFRSPKYTGREATPGDSVCTSCTETVVRQGRRVWPYLARSSICP